MTTPAQKERARRLQKSIDAAISGKPHKPRTPREFTDRAASEARTRKESLPKPLHRQIEEAFHTTGGTSLDFSMWYHTQNPFLNGRIPAELVRDGKGHEVLDMLRSQ